MWRAGCIFIGVKEIDTMADNSMKKKHRKMSGRKKVMLFAAEILLLLVVVAVVVLWNSTLGKIKFESKLTDSEAGINEDIEESTLLTMGGYTNIALFGLDNRSRDRYDNGNSDSIMVASINNTTKKVKIASVYRDTFLNVGDDKYRKINSAYARGGITNAVRALNENLDLNITAYACVDWNALVDAIDALGGVELEITDDEMRIINDYVEDTARCSDSEPHPVEHSGKVVLDGLQATSYARIRYTKGMDFERASRQRIVLQAMLDKAKAADFAELTQICNAVFGQIQTSLQLKDILYLAKSLPDFDLEATSGFPTELAMVSYNGEEIVVPVDLYENVAELHKFLFDEQDYVPSQTVQDRNTEIINLTGVTIDYANKYSTTKLNDTVGSNGTTSLWEKENETETEEPSEN